MKIRAIFISSHKRISELNRLHHSTLPDSILQRFVYFVSGLSKTEKELVTIHPGLSAFSTAVADTFFLFLEEGRSWPHEITTRYPQLLFFPEKNTVPSWKLRQTELDFGGLPIIMGILNITPDSFSDGGRFTKKKQAVEHAIKMVEEGARIIDVGGESTRPGAEPVSPDEELKRVVPVIEEIRRHSEVLISVDTYRSGTARAALEAGADMINDISGAQFDAEMAETARSFDCPMIVMHIKGTPKNMQKNPYYSDVTAEIYEYFEERLHYLKEQGLSKIILDPGIGFGKRTEDNLHILRDLRDFTFLQYPVLIGLSRKSFIGNTLDRPVEERSAGTLAAHVSAALNGASVLRVHDVKETADALRMQAAIQNS